MTLRLCPYLYHLNIKYTLTARERGREERETLLTLKVCRMAVICQYVDKIPTEKQEDHDGPISFT